ncbi:MAG: hypothetical protein HP495_15995 [Nitrospira sp.]|nr:hypothetical protein [Nitrospira sp.]
MIDINSGTLDQLKTLVGIGDTYAMRIMAARPYQCAGELVTKHVVPYRIYDKIRDHIAIISK